MWTLLALWVALVGRMCEKYHVLHFLKTFYNNVGKYGTLYDSVIQDLYKLLYKHICYQTNLVLLKLFTKYTF